MSIDASFETEVDMKIGRVLCGGDVRGIAHLGVWQRLEELGTTTRIGNTFRRAVPMYGECDDDFTKSQKVN